MVQTSTRKAPPVGIKRIHRAVDKEEIIRLMTSEDLGVFREIWRLLSFAAQVGFANDRREPLTQVDSGKGIDQTTFGNSPAWPGVLYLMALAESGSAEKLSGSQEADDARISLFQEYANGGLSLLREFFRDRQVDLDGILAFLDSHDGVRVKGTSPDVAI